MNSERNTKPATGILAAFSIYADGYASLMDTWLRTGEYRHGFLILPIAAWLAYLSRRQLDGVVLKPDVLGWLGKHIDTCRPRVDPALFHSCDVR